MSCVWGSRHYSTLNVSTGLKTNVLNYWISYVEPSSYIDAHSYCSVLKDFDRIFSSLGSTQCQMDKYEVNRTLTVAWDRQVSLPFQKAYCHWRVRAEPMPVLCITRILLHLFI